MTSGPESAARRVSFSELLGAHQVLECWKVIIAILPRSIDLSFCLAWFRSGGQGSDAGRTESFHDQPHRKDQFLQEYWKNQQERSS